jgi:hypothetical protein
MYSWKIIYENIYFNVSHDFSKFDGSKKTQGVTFIVLPPKDGLAQLLFLQN